MTIAAMESILRLYLDPDRLAERLPTLRLLTRPQSGIRAQADRIAPALAAALAGLARVEVIGCASQIGSGALPVDTLPSAGIALSPPATVRGEGRWIKALADRLRALPVPVIGRVANGALILDCRTLDREELFLAQLAAAFPGQA